MNALLRALVGESVRLLVGTPYAVSGRVEAVDHGFVTVHHADNGTRSYVPLDKIASVNVDKKVVL